MLIDGRLQPMCCPGCAAVASSIVASGLEGFYRQRTSFSTHGAEAGLLPDNLPLYDSAEQVAAAADGAACAEASFTIEGLRCAACVWLIERRLARVPGVQAVELNVSRERVLVRWSRAECRPSHIIGALRDIGYVAYPYDVDRHGELLERSLNGLFRRLFVAALSMMQVMNYVIVFYLDRQHALEPGLAVLMQWASLILTAPAVFYSAQPFFLGAWQDLKNRMPGMDVPVALGIAAAFGGSVWATVRGSGDVYYDSVTMFIFLLLASRYLELMARRKAAGALEKLQHALPAGATLMPHWPASRVTELVAAARLAAGDVILVKPGESLAADGVILEGHSELDLSLLTGESRPVSLAPGASLPGGAVNVAQALVVRVSRGLQESTLSMLLKLVEKAGAQKPRLSQWADQVAAWFVGALLLFALLVFAWWQMVDAPRAWPIAIAVLVVSCPCALSLATPTALATATDRLLRQGVLIVAPHVLESLHRASHVVFDKTGTLTVGRPVVRHVEMLGSLPAQQCLRLAATLEAASAHPLAAAIAAAAAGLAPGEAAGVRYCPGQGLEASVDGVLYRLGGAGFVAELAGSTPPEPDSDLMTMVYLASAAGLLARFEIADTLREDARAVVAHFQRQGKTVVLLSGDRQAVTRRVADQLGVSVARGEVLPEGKLAYVQQLQAGGAIVAMVGDGINDAAVLSAADVSFAMGGGAALAQLHADCVLLSGRLAALRDASTCASQTIGVIRQNLAWASVYNLIAIPVAALGWLNPWLSGIGMSVSSAVVVLNALRLRRVPVTANRESS